MSCAACDKSPCRERACGRVMRVKVCEKGRKGAPMVTLEVRRPMASEVKKPDSCRLRCSKAMKPKVASRSSGKPSVAPYCARVKGGFLLGALSMVGGNV